MTEPLLTRPFGSLVAGHFLQALGYASMLTLPLYLDHLGASRATVGTVMAVAAIGGLALRPVVGWAIDAVGRRPTIIVGTLCLAIGAALLGAVTEVGPLLYASRVLVGIGAGTLFTAYFAFAADVIPESRRTEGIALFGVSGLVPLMVNPAVESLTLPPGDLRFVFVGVGVLVLLSLVPTLTVPEPAPLRPSGTATRPGPPLKALLARRLWPVWVAATAFSLLVAVFMAFATVVAENRGLSNPARLWYGYAAAAAGVRLIGPGLPGRLGPANFVGPALAAYAIAGLWVAEASTATELILAGALAGVGHGYCFPVLTGQVVTRAPDGRRGAALATFSGLWEVTAIGATPVFGALADEAGDGTMFAVAALAGLIGLVLWVPLEHRRGREATQNQTGSKGAKSEG